MELLSAVNLVLPALGEHVVTSVNPKHPTVNLIVQNMTQQRRELLGRGWWFNTRTVMMYPNTDGEIHLPEETLSVLSPNAVQDGDKLVDPTTLYDKWTTGQKCVLYLDREFNRLPEYAANVVLYRALVAAYLTDIGREALLQDWQAKEQLNYAHLTAEHLRNRNYSTRRSGAYQRIVRNIRGR